MVDVFQPLWLQSLYFINKFNSNSITQTQYDRQCHVYLQSVSKKVIDLQRAIVRELLGVSEHIFFIFVTIRLLAVEWHVFHAKWRKNKQVRGR